MTDEEKLSLTRAHATATGRLNEEKLELARLIVKVEALRSQPDSKERHNGLVQAAEELKLAQKMVREWHGILETLNLSGEM